MAVQICFQKNCFFSAELNFNFGISDNNDNIGVIDTPPDSFNSHILSHQCAAYSDNNLHYHIIHNGQVLCMTVPGENGVGLYQENGTYNQIKYNWENKTILIAEDEEANFLYLKTALCRTGVKIIRAKTGKEAVEMVKENECIDLVLMDIKMPEMNGIDATKEIKALNNNIKVIAQTAYAMEEDKISYFNAGCIDYLEKPIKRDLLLTVISKHI